MKRDRSSREAALSRLNSQMPITEKLQYADIVLDNSGSLQDLESQIDSFLRRINDEVGWSWKLSWWIPPFGFLSAVSTLLWRALARSRARDKKERKERAVRARNVGRDRS